MRNFRVQVILRVCLLALTLLVLALIGVRTQLTEFLLSL